jgi:chromosome segregation protein
MAARDEARAATQTRLSEAEADERSARAALETFRQRHDDLDRRVREAEAEANGLERVLTPPVPGRVAPVLTMLTIASGYEKALAAALGDDLNAPVASQGATRWHDAAETRAAGLPPLPDGAEPLAPHVIAPKALAARLAQIGWVRDAQAGAQIAPRLLPGQRMVSLEGHLWRWDGFTRTPDAPLPEAERLHQRARLERVKAELTKARTDRQDAAAALEDARRAARDADALLRSLRTMLADAVRDLASARESVLRAEAASEASGLRRQAADDNLARTQNRLSAIAEALAQLPAPDANALTPLEKALTTARDRLTAARQADNAAQLALAEHERQAEQAEGRRRAISRDLEEWTRRRDRARERLNEIASRRDAARAALDATPDGQDGETDAEALSDDVRRLERERQQAADAVARADTAQREADTRSRQATRDAAESRQADASAVAALLAAETRREELDATIRAQFGCTPAGLPGRAAGLDPASLEDLNLAAVERDLLSLRNEREALGGVNPEAEAEAADLESRLGQQAAEKADLTAAIARLREGIDALNAEGRDRLMAAFESVRGHFAALFTALFQGGQAELRLVDADDPLAAGLEIFAQPPGKRLSTLSLMSGGEQALTATALIFAVFLSNPAPICVLDEVDAPLDDANVDRFCRLLDEMRQRTQTRFLVITHNPVTMSRMDRLYGVTMRERGVSKLVSVDLRTAEDLVAAQ